VVSAKTVYSPANVAIIRSESKSSPDRLELRCVRCGAVSVVYAETEEDTAIALKINELELIQNGIMFLDGIHEQVRKR